MPEDDGIEAEIDEICDFALYSDDEDLVSNRNKLFFEKTYSKLFLTYFTLKRFSKTISQRSKPVKNVL